MRELKGEKLEKELQRLDAMLSYEREYAALAPLCGIDEAGRGPLAGPVAAAAVILPENCRILYLNDSKKLSPARRDALFDEIREKAVSYSIAVIPAERIDEINILQATRRAMERCAAGFRGSMILIDALEGLKLPCEARSLIHGDALSYMIGAASIVAKVARDRYMIELDAKYPMYGFARNKGYGTAEHIAALKKYGPCPEHRRSFIGGILGEGHE